MSEPRRPGLGSVIDQAVSAGLRDLYTLIPARVKKWDASNQKADCQILIKNVTEGEGDEREVNSWPVVPGVPVQFPGAGPFRVTFPISDGNLNIDGITIRATTGSLVFAFRSMDKWLSGDGKEVDPEFDHDHELTDAVFLPGLNPFGAALSVCPTDHMTAGYEGGPLIHYRSGTIVIGTENGAQKTLKAETLIQDLTSLMSTLNTILLAGTAGSAVKQMLVQAAQFALTTLYMNLQSGGSAYLSTEVKNA